MTDPKDPKDARPARPAFAWHPLFPRADGSPEDADIRFVTFLRRVDGVLQHCPEDLPRDEVQTWSQVMERWGGGDYQAIAKTDKHVVIRHYPNKGEWMSLDGEPLPFVKRGARHATAAHATRAPEAAAPPAAPPALPAGMAEVLGVLTKLADRLDRMQERMTTAPQSGGNEVIIAMIKAQASREAATTQAHAAVAAAEARARGEAQAAEARARADAQVAMAEAIAENNKFLLGVLTKGGDGSGQLASLRGMLKPEAVQTVPHQDPLALLQRYKDLGLLVAPAAASLLSEIKPIVDTICGAITERIQADCQARVAETEVRKAEIQAGRGLGEPPRREREGRPLVYVSGLGVVDIVAAEMVPVAPVPVVQLPAPSAPAPSAPVAAPVASTALSAPTRPAEAAAQPPSPPTVAMQPAPAESVPQIPDLDIEYERMAMLATEPHPINGASPIVWLERGPALPVLEVRDDVRRAAEESLRSPASAPAIGFPECMPARPTEGVRGGGDVAATRACDVSRIAAPALAAEASRAEQAPWPERSKRIDLFRPRTSVRQVTPARRHSSRDATMSSPVSFLTGVGSMNPWTRSMNGTVAGRPQAARRATG